MIRLGELEMSRRLIDRHAVAGSVLNEPDVGSVLGWPKMIVEAGFSDRDRLLYILLTRYEMPMP